LARPPAKNDFNLAGIVEFQSPQRLAARRQRAPRNDLQDFVAAALVLVDSCGTIERRFCERRVRTFPRGALMLRGGMLLAAWAGVFVIPAAAWGQASFGPIQPFAGAPTPVYVAGPYAAPTALAPIGAPAIGAPAIFGTTPPQIQIPPATLPPSLGAAPGAVIAPQTTVALPSTGCGCGATQQYRPLLGAPTINYSPLGTPGAAYGAGVYGQPLLQSPVQSFPGYGQ
jgi:hypothetical protein